MTVSAAAWHSAGRKADGLTPQSPLRTARQIPRPRINATGIGVTQPGAIGSITHV